MGHKTRDTGREAQRALRTAHSAFTLVELLVVVAIIAVLLALLAPAMDKAMYQAELAVCGTRLKGTATGVVAYAMGNARQYPIRSGVRSAANFYPFALRYDGYDDRPAIEQAIDINGLLNDPAAGTVDMELPSTANVVTAYSLWFGWRYDVGGPTNAPPAENGMYRIGQRWEWAGRKYDLLASDHDRIDMNHGHDESLCSHPDESGVLNQLVQQDNTWALADWRNLYALRGRVSLNFLYEDGSVRRFNGVKPDDDRMTMVPDRSDAAAQDYWWDTVPTR